MLSEHLGDHFWRLIAEGLVTGAIAPRTTESRCVGGVHIAPEKSGRIVSMPSDETLRAIGGVMNWHRMKSVGDTYTASHAADWCLFVIIAAPTREEYEATLTRLAEEALINVHAE
jgi:hypothetical protein